jgi:hypothetical protein
LTADAVRVLVEEEDLLSEVLFQKLAVLRL